MPIFKLVRIARANLKQLKYKKWVKKRGKPHSIRAFETIVHTSETICYAAFKIPIYFRIITKPTYLIL